MTLGPHWYRTMLTMKGWSGVAGPAGGVSSCHVCGAV